MEGSCKPCQNKNIGAPKPTQQKSRSYRNRGAIQNSCFCFVSANIASKIHSKAKIKRGKNEPLRRESIDNPSVFTSSCTIQLIQMFRPPLLKDRARVSPIEGRRGVAPDFSDLVILCKEGTRSPGSWRKGGDSEEALKHHIFIMRGGRLGADVWRKAIQVYLL